MPKVLKVWCGVEREGGGSPREREREREKEI